MDSENVLLLRQRRSRRTWRRVKLLAYPSAYCSLAFCRSYTDTSRPMLVMGKVVGMNTNIVSHVPHQACSKVQEHDLEIDDAFCS